MKTLISISLGLLLSITAISQSCLPSGIVFTTQAQVDSFQSNYPGCTEIGGNVYIGYQDYETNITNLTGLNSLQSIGLDLYIGQNDSLINLTGLENLNYIGRDLYITSNDTLTTLEGIENLISIGGDLYIIANNSLCTCEAQGICNYLSIPSGSVNIIDNANGCNNPSDIASACGITLNCLPFGSYYFLSQSDVDNFQSYYPECNDIQGQFVISGNDISNLNGLSQVTSIESFLWIESASLMNLSGLENVNSTGGLVIWYNSNLTSISGLDNLVSINGLVEIDFNDSLLNLSGLENLNQINGSLQIDYNGSLNSIEAIENIESGTITDLYILGNSNLSNCQIESICNYLANPNGEILIQYNALGCNDLEEVEEACEVGLAEPIGNKKQATIKIFPNPSSDILFIETPEKMNRFQFSIMDLNGQELIRERISEPTRAIDVSHLPVGIYLLKISNETEVNIYKVVKY